MPDEQQAAPPDVVGLAIAEPMTIYEAAAHKARLVDCLAQSGGLELDLSQVAEIDTAGLQLLLLAKRESQRAGKTLRIAAHSQAVHELIDFFNVAALLGDPLVFPPRPAAR